MHRLLVDGAALASAAPTLPPEARAHLKVLRPRDGEAVELFDGCGNARVYRWRAAERALGDPDAPKPSAPRPAPLTLFACVTKGSRWDWTVEKAVELGATRVVPVLSARTIVRIPPAERAAKRARWQRVAEDAARQSDALWLPEICEPVDFADALPRVRETTCFVGALTNPPPPPLAAAVLDFSRQNFSHQDFSHQDFSLFTFHFSLFTGPEGDFTPEELAALLEIATPTSFGPTILRAETAAIFGLSVLKALREAGRA